MVGCIIPNDRGNQRDESSSSVFASRSDIAIMMCVTTAKKRGGTDTAKMCNAIKYMTKNYEMAPRL